MKRRYILTFLIPIILAAVIAYIMTPNAKQSLITKLTDFENRDNIFYEVAISYPQETRSAAQKMEQYKFGGKYYAKYYQNGYIPVIVNTSDNEVKFGTEFISSTLSTAQLKEENNVFMMDKLSVSDIKKDSVKRDKNANEDKYFATLNDGTDIEVTFGKKGVLSKVVYKNVVYVPAILNLGSKSGDVCIEISGVRNVTEISKDFIVPAKTINVSSEELKAAVINDNFEYEGGEEAFENFKRVFNIDSNIISEEEYTDGENQEEMPEEVTEDSIHDVEEDFSNVEESEEPQIDFEMLDNHDQSGLEPETPPDFE